MINSEHVARWLNLVEHNLSQLFTEQMNIPQTLVESMNYSLQAGGKRIRPLLMLCATDALEGNVEAAVPAACAIELIHTYSLIHDDLPAMDNDDYRRGKLTNHKVFGEAIAILSGDALLTHAFYLLAKLGRTGVYPAQDILKVIEEMSWYAGPRGMVGGQVLDMEGEQGLTSIEQLKAIHRHKTGDLIVFSLRAGGHLAGATNDQLSALERYGQCIGMAFQIQDDILDEVGDEQAIGKKVRSDAKSGKVTFPTFLSIEECKQKVREYTEQGKQAIIDGCFPKPDLLLRFADQLMTRDR